jgi:hypothetical protein
MSYQLSTAWKASLTRTPPPICTSTLGSQTALIWRAVGVANAIDVHQAEILTIRESTRSNESSAVLQRCHREVGKQASESVHRIPRVTKWATLAKNFHKIFT